MAGARASGTDASTDAALQQAEHDLANGYQQVKTMSASGGAAGSAAAQPQKLREDAAPPHPGGTKGLSAEGAFDEGVDATLEAISTLLHKLELSTLKQALADLALPTDGGKRELSERITNALQQS